MQVLHVSTNGVKESVDPGDEIIPVPDENEQTQIDEVSILDKSFSQIYSFYSHPLAKNNFATKWENQIFQIKSIQCEFCKFPQY